MPNDTTPNIAEMTSEPPKYDSDFDSLIDWTGVQGNSADHLFGEETTDPGNDTSQFSRVSEAGLQDVSGSEGPGSVSIADQTRSSANLLPKEVQDVLEWDADETKRQFEKVAQSSDCTPQNLSETLFATIHPDSQRVLRDAQEVIRKHDCLFLVRHQSMALVKLYMAKCKGVGCEWKVIATPPHMGITVGMIEPRTQPYQRTKVRQGKCPDCYQKRKEKRKLPTVA